jgi:DNA repair exonuclease SbcCD nuclease subunit
MVRFLHTSDWQLGMTRYFFSEGTQERYNQARFDAIRTLGKIAKAENCQFITVCGDVFESNQVERKTVDRALEALRELTVPVFILPGNHDPLNDVSVYRSSVFTHGKPAHVHVIDNSIPFRIGDNVELVGAPLEMVKNYVTLASNHVAMQHHKYSPLDRLNLRGIG